MGYMDSKQVSSMRASRARDLEPLEVELNEPRLRLKEQEMRRSFRDASED